MHLHIKLQQEICKGNDVTDLEVFVVTHVTLSLLIGFHFGHHVGKESDE